MKNLLIYLLAITMLGLAPAVNAQQDGTPLFEPVGYGKNVTGGRGGKFIKVTRTDDARDEQGRPLKGTLRAAVETWGPRIVVFEVSGVITFNERLMINKDDITIAGQTAPGEGITLQNGPSNTDPTLTVNADNVIVQYLKIRTGDAMAEKLKGKSDVNVDAITVVEGGSNVIIDHLSLSWAIDETVQLWSTENVSLQNCIIAESLANSAHPYSQSKNTEHGRGQLHGCAILVGVKKNNTSVVESGGNVSIYQNLMAHNSRRNPRLHCDKPVEVVNNVIYNPGGADKGIYQPAVVADKSFFAGQYDFINNYLKAGNNTDRLVTNFENKPQVDYDNEGDPPAHLVGGQSIVNAKSRIFVKGNRVPDGTRQFAVELNGNTSGSALNETDIPIRSAQQAYTRVLAAVGDSYRLNRDGSTTLRRDELDTRWVNDVKEGTGIWVDEPRQLPIPSNARSSYVDSDGDGMPDAYEDLYEFLDKNTPDDATKDEDKDGIINVEEYLWATSPGEKIPTTTCDTDPPTNGTYMLIARHSQKALAVDLNRNTNGGYNSKDNRANVFQYGDVDNSSDNRLWELTEAENGYYKLISVHSQKALAVDKNRSTNGGYNDATRNGVNIFQFGTDGSDNRLWKIEPVGDCHYRLMNKYSKKMLDVSGVSDRDGANVHQWENTNGRNGNQSWKLVKINRPLALSTTMQPAIMRAETALLRAYPNPASDRLTVAGSMDYRATLYDLNGRTVLHREHLSGNVQLDIQQLRPGIYFVTLRDEQDEQPEVQQRIIVQ